MTRVLTLAERDEWRRLVESFESWDVYYLPEYAEALRIHGDGQPLLIYGERGQGRICWVVMQADISEAGPFIGAIPAGRYRDWQTPYGYGGPLVEGEWAVGDREAFFRELAEYCRGNGVVSQFTRFHPLLQNWRDYDAFGEVRRLRETIFVDTTNEGLISANMDGKNRNMVRKARKLGVEVRESRDSIGEFQAIYRDTMDRHGAGEYYYFKSEYFAFLLDELPGNIVYFTASYEGKPVSSALFLYNERYIHYHLAGTLRDYRHLAAANLIVYEAALWACGRGIKALHLGGGLAEGDSLYGFKKQFNKAGGLPFYVGRTIFDREAYDSLMRTRRDLDPAFPMDNDFLIGYRK